MASGQAPRRRRPDHPAEPVTGSPIEGGSADQPAAPNLTGQPQEPSVQPKSAWPGGRPPEDLGLFAEMAARRHAEAAAAAAAAEEAAPPATPSTPIAVAANSANLVERISQVFTYAMLSGLYGADGFLRR